MYGLVLIQSTSTYHWVAVRIYSLLSLFIPLYIAMLVFSSYGSSRESEKERVLGSIAVDRFLTGCMSTASYWIEEFSLFFDQWLIYTYSLAQGRYIIKRNWEDILSSETTYRQIDTVVTYWIDYCLTLSLFFTISSTGRCKFIYRSGDVGIGIDTRDFYWLGHVSCLSIALLVKLISSRGW